MALSQRLEFRQTPSAGDDAAADAGHQAAATVQPRSRRLCRRRTGAQSAARARQRRRRSASRGAPSRKPPRPKAPKAARTPRPPPTGSARTWRPAVPPWKSGLGTELENVFPDDSGRKSTTRRRKRRRRPIRNGPGRAASGGEDGDYNLEAFVTAEITLAAHLAEQMALAISDPAGRMIGQYLIDMVDEAGYLTGDLDAVADKLGAPRRRGRSRARDPADARSARRLRAQSHRMPRDPAQGPRPLRSGDAHAGRASRSLGQARSRRACAVCAASTRKISPT